MYALILALSALAMSPGEAVDAALARSPALDVAEARVAEARARLRGTTARLLPTVTVSGGVVAQTRIEVDLTDKLPEIPILDPSEVDPLLVQPGLQLQGRAELVQPLLALPAWLGRDAARQGIAVAQADVDADRVRVARSAVEAFHASAEAHAMLEDARRAEELAARLLEKGETLARLGAVAEADVLPFRRGHATARANLALAREAVLLADGVLGAVTGLSGAADPPPVPAVPPPIEEVLAAVDRPDLKAAARRVEAARALVGVERAAMYPSLALTAGAAAVTPTPDFGEELTWRVGVGATVPLFQGGAVGARVDESAARATAAEAAVRAMRDAAEIEVRMAHGALSRALASLAEQEEAVRLAARAVEAAERRLDEGGGSLLELHQARLEQVAAEVRRTRARAEAARAADLLALAARGTI